MATPVFVGDPKAPLFIDGVPMFADDPCDCCHGEPPCPPCEYPCTPWASGRLEVIGDCSGSTVHVRVTDTSVLPAGYCNKIVGISGTGWDTISPGVWERDVPKADCHEVTISVNSGCCDETKCGGCSDSVTIKTSYTTCCCYGGACVDGVPGDPQFPDVALSFLLVEHTAQNGGDCTDQLYGMYATALAGSHIIPFNPAVWAATGGATPNYFETPITTLSCRCDDFGTECCKYKLVGASTINCDGGAGPNITIKPVNRTTDGECVGGFTVPSGSFGTPTGSDRGDCHGSTCYPNWELFLDGGNIHMKGFCISW